MNNDWIIYFFMYFTAQIFVFLLPSRYCVGTFCDNDYKICNWLFISVQYMHFQSVLYTFFLFQGIASHCHTLSMIIKPRFEFNIAVLFNQKILNIEYWIGPNVEFSQIQVHYNCMIKPFSNHLKVMSTFYLFYLIILIWKRGLVKHGGGITIVYFSIRYDSS